MSHDCRRDGCPETAPVRLPFMEAYQVRCPFCGTRGQVAVIAAPDYRRGSVEACEIAEGDAQDRALSYWLTYRRST